MRQLKLILTGTLATGAFAANLFFALQLGNALFLAPAIVLASALTLLLHRPSWFILLFGLVFLDIRGEVGGVPVHLWEIHLLTAAALLLFKPGNGGFNRIELGLVILFGVAVLSAVLNTGLAQGLKSAARWVEYLVVYRTARLAAAPLFSGWPAPSLARLLAAPLLALALLGAIQATVIKGDWARVLEGRTGALLLGPVESKSRILKNNFEFVGEHGESFRASGLYLSAVDFSAVLMISIAIIGLKGHRSPLTVAAILVGVVALILSMGRASLLYGAISIGVAALLYQRRLRTLLALGALLLAVVGGLLAYAPARERLLALTDTEQNSEEERILIWRTGLNIWKSSPLYGKGGGSTASLFDDNASADWLAGRQGSTHSTYVGTLAELGVLGLAAWLYFLWTLRGDLRGAHHPGESKTLLCFCLLFFVIMGISSDTYTAGSPYFILLLLLFGWHSHDAVATEGNAEVSAAGLNAAKAA